MRASRPARVMWLFAAAACLTAAACGNRVSHDRVVAAAGVATATTVAGGGLTAAPNAEGGLAAEAADPGTGGAQTVAGSGGADGAGSTGGTDGSSSTGSGATGGTIGGGTPVGGRPRPATGSPVVVGTLGHYSGVFGGVFPGGASAMQAWAQAANARGGLNGHPIKLVTGDDGGDPARALSLVRQMVEEKGAIALVGAMVPFSFQGIRTYLEEKNVPLIGGDVTLPDWIESPVVFPSGTDVTSISIAAVNLLREAGGTKLAIIYCGESPSCLGLARIAEENPPPGMSVVYTAQTSVVQTDFTTECIQARDRGADAIFVASDSSATMRVGRACAQQGLHPVFGTASIAVGPQLVEEPTLDGLIAPTNNAPWFDTSTPGGAELARAMQTYAPGAPLTATASTMYASGKLLEAASGDFGENPTSADVLAGLRALRNETADGLAPPLTFRNGPSGPIGCYFVVKVQRGKWVAPNGATPKCV